MRRWHVVVVWTVYFKKLGHARIVWWVDVWQGDTGEDGAEWMILLFLLSLVLFHIYSPTVFSFFIQSPFPHLPILSFPLSKGSLVRVSGYFGRLRLYGMKLLAGDKGFQSYGTQSLIYHVLSRVL